MSANRSRRAVRSAILSAGTDEYAGWELLVSCGPCARLHESVPVSALGVGTVAEGIQKLRCRGCGARPTGVLISNAGQGWRQQTVALVGDGAYG